MRVLREDKPSAGWQNHENSGSADLQNSVKRCTIQAEDTSGQEARRMKRYSEEQLKDCSKEELIDIVLDVQNRALVYEGNLNKNTPEILSKPNMSI